MTASDRLAGELERRCLDAVEAAVLADRVGAEFDAACVELNASGGTVQLRDPAVLARCEGPVQLGARLRVRLVEADPREGRVRFVPAGKA